MRRRLLLHSPFVFASRIFCRAVRFLPRQIDRAMSSGSVDNNECRRRQMRTKADAGLTAPCSLKMNARHLRCAVHIVMYLYNNKLYCCGLLPFDDIVEWSAEGFACFLLFLGILKLFRRTSLSVYRLHCNCAKKSCVSLGMLSGEIIEKHRMYCHPVPYAVEQRQAGQQRRPPSAYLRRLISYKHKTNYIDRCLPMDLM